MQRQVYYGFSAKFLKWGQDSMENFDEWVKDMHRLMDQEGVLYKGQSNSVGNSRDRIVEVLSGT